MDEAHVKLSRRGLLSGMAAFTAAAALDACSDDTRPELQPYDDVENEAFDYLPPTSLPDGVRRFFTSDEFRALETLMGRMLPGSADDPGAVEAGAAHFVDIMLDEYDDFDEPTYRLGPFAVDVPDDQSTALPEGVSELDDDTLDRYGFQSALTPQQIYRRGLASLDHWCRDIYGSPLAELDVATQDEIVGALEDGSAGGFEHPSADAFFERVRDDMIHGVFADPAYGGNRDFIGWRLIGYPGAQRAWTERELKAGPDSNRRVQGLHHLHPSRPGRPSPSAIEPVQQPDEAVHG